MRTKIELLNAIVATLSGSDGEEDYVIPFDVKNSKKETLIFKSGDVIKASDLSKAESGNNAAKSRIRKTLRNIKTFAGELIKEVK